MVSLCVCVCVVSVQLLPMPTCSSNVLAVAVADRGTRFLHDQQPGQRTKQEIVVAAQVNNLSVMLIIVV